MSLSNTLCALKKSLTNVRTKVRGRFRPTLELLEDRTAPAVFTVNTVQDVVAGSLRAAIVAANTTPGADTINFNIPGAGVKSILLFSALPAVTERVTFAGETQGASATPLVEISGILFTGPSANGLVLKAAGTVVRSLGINSFAGNGILVLRPACVVQGCLIGTFASVSSPAGNQLHGVLITGTATGVRIGGALAGQGNVISANGLAGVAIQGALANGNFVQGNRIGTNAAGNTDFGNGFDGVLIAGGARSNVIGGAVSGAGNVISGNNANGVEIFGAGTTGNLVQGNLIGTAANGAVAIANSLDGVLITDDASANTVGGAVAAARNVISANLKNGIHIRGGASNVVLGNYIGTSAAGNADLGNGEFGVFIFPSTNTIIGGTTPGAGNVISGNTGSGIHFVGTGTAATGGKVQGNFIGTNAAGTAAIPNGSGIDLFFNVSKITIGGTVAGARNVISGNTNEGVGISGSDIIANDPTGILVLGNYIGTDVTGTSFLGNGVGVRIVEAQMNTIGGTVAGARNVISGNTIGVQIAANATKNLIQGNFIGANAAGNASLGNVTGIEILDAATNTVGGAVAGAGNVVSGNFGNGIVISGTEATANRVQGNFIGASATGAADLGNGSDGVRLTSGAFSNIVGGTILAARNVISGNNRMGVFIVNLDTHANLVQGNFIGLAANGAPLGNSNAGVYISDLASDNMIGGILAGAGNSIAHNGGDGVLIGLDAAVGPTAQPADDGNSVQGNRIFNNAEHGIDLGNDDGATPNDPNDSDLGPNSLLNKPVLTSAFLDGAMLHITGFLDAFAPVRIEFFANASGGQGQIFLGAMIPPTGSKFAFSKILAVPASVTAGQTLTATLTDLFGNTSEFSIPLTIE